MRSEDPGGDHASGPCNDLGLVAELSPVLAITGNARDASNTTRGRTAVSRRSARAYAVITVSIGADTVPASTLPVHDLTSDSSEAERWAFGPMREAVMQRQRSSCRRTGLVRDGTGYGVPLKGMIAMSSEREHPSNLLENAGDERRMKIRVHVRIMLRKLIIHRIGKHESAPGVSR